MDAPDAKQVFNTDLPVQKNMKSPGPEKVAAGVKNKPGQEEDRIDIFQGDDNINQINLCKKQCEQYYGYDYC